MTRTKHDNRRLTGKPSTRQLILQHLTKGLPAAQKRFDAKTGRFLGEGGGWAVTMQDVVFPLALLYTADVPYNRLHGNRRILHLAARAGDALRNWQDKDGRFEFIKPDGSRWGKTYMCWSMYHWLEAFALLREHLDARRRRRWEKGLRLCFAGVFQEQCRHFRVHNIPTWHAMSLVRAGQVLEEPEWIELGARNCRITARHQNGDGYWPEGGGPTTGYNLYYVHALGLYYHFTRDREVLPALRRAAEFHRHFTYPNGAAVETVDGRVKYRDQVLTIGYPGFAVTPEGRGLVSFLVERLRQRYPRGALVPALASAWQHVPDEPGIRAPQVEKNYFAIYPTRRGRALIRRRGPWFVCLSGYLVSPRQRMDSSFHRWHMDRQQYLSIWHDDVGLMVGGGNSKNQPERSNFIVWSGGRCRFTADGAKLETSTADIDSLLLRFGGLRCTLSVQVLSRNKVELVFATASGAKQEVTVGFGMPFSAGWQLTNSLGGSPQVADPMRTWEVQWPENKAKGKQWFETDRYRVWLPPGSRLNWPVYPFNPYAINNAAPPGEAVAYVHAHLPAGGGEGKFIIQAKSTLISKSARNIIL